VLGLYVSLGLHLSEKHAPNPVLELYVSLGLLLDENHAANQIVSAICDAPAMESDPRASQ